jgi:methionine sulfoxide reductase heme-binding subunit
MSKRLVWIICSLPLVWTLVWTIIGASPFWKKSFPVWGYSAASLLVICLVSSPLKKSFPAVQFFLDLSRRKKQTGLAAFCYALLHASAYFIKKKISTGFFPWDSLLHLEILPGLIALTILTIMALTSDDYWIRKLGKRWKSLHRTVYIAEACVFLHMAFQGGNVLMWGCLLFVPLLFFQRLRVCRRFF